MYEWIIGLDNESDVCPTSVEADTKEEALVLALDVFLEDGYSVTIDNLCLIECLPNI